MNNPSATVEVADKALWTKDLEDTKSAVTKTAT